MLRLRIGLVAFSALVLSFALVSFPASATGTAVDHGAKSTEVRKLDIKEVRLDNGLRIFVLERTVSPTFAALYQFDVGGATDPKGRSGIAHLLEHMMFKGTRTVGTLDAEKETTLMRRLAELWNELHAELDKREDPFRQADEENIARLEKEIEAVSAEQKGLIVKNEYDELMTRAGSVSMNASTNWDATRYYLQLPANQLELWFRTESDRLLNPVFREFYSERDVVHEERRMRTENSAYGRASEATRSLLFTAHPYGTPVVGWPRDIERLERADAMAYFTTYYSPSNCVMVFVGDVETAEIERLAKKYFGPWKRQDIPRLPITAEPPQQGARRRVVEFDAEPHMRIAWRTVPEGHPDQYALDVLAMILGGLNSSRVDQTIVQKERIATRAGTGHPTMKHAGYFSAFGVLRGEHATAELEEAFEREIRRIQTDGVTDQEVERARTAVEASRVRGLKSNLGQASRIASAVSLSGSLDYIYDYETRINGVTPDDVKRVASEYLKPSRKNVVEVSRVEGLGAEGPRGGAGVEHRHGGSIGERGQKHSTGFRAAMQLSRSAAPVTLRIPEIGKDVQRVELDSGITVFIKEDHTAPSIQMTLRWDGGSNTMPVEDLAPFKLASSLLNEGGTEELTPEELETRKDELGMNVGVWVGENSSGGSFWSLERNFEESFELALDVWMRPRLDPERLETLKGQYIERMRRRAESANGGAGVLLRHVIYKDHPRLGYTPSKTEIEAITPQQIRKIWKRYAGRDNLYISVVGDFDAKEMLELIDSKFRRWRKARDSERRWITHDPILRPGIFLVTKELPQAAVRVYHQLSVDRTAPLEEHAALEILNDILGGSGFRSRLMERMRSDEGLTYGVYSGIRHQGRPGVPGRISIGYQTKRDSVARSIESALEETRRIVAEKVGEPEVNEQIEAWRNRFIFNYTDDAVIVSRLMGSEREDRPYDYDRQLLEAVQKVTVDDVKRAAEKYISPDKVTVVIFGALTEEDRKLLGEKFDFAELKKEEVFTGGYEEAEQADEPARIRAAS